MPMDVMKRMQRSNRILGALATVLWMAPAAAQTASGAGGATSTTVSGGPSDRAGQETSVTESQTAAGTEPTTATSGTSNGGEPDRAMTDSQTTAGTGSTTSTSDTSASTETGKARTRGVLDEDPGRWPYAGRSSSDRGR
ncbi:MAG TPA: hypothetical protein VF805_02465 [Anaeromyxobacteraceae bacterium]